MSVQGVQAAPEPAGRLAYKWKVLISVVFGIFMIILDSTVVNVAFQTLRTEFGAALNDSQWVISVYVLALGITTPLSGFLADRFGAKRVYLTGLGVFVFGSILCGLAPNLGLLIAARALQGFGGGMAQPLASALLFGAFPPKEQGLALGIFGIALLVAPASGPILGGLLVDAGVWRWIFFVNVPVGIVGITLASRWLRGGKSQRAFALDPLGLITSIIGFGAVLFAASNAAERGWTSPTVLISFIVGAVALVSFALIELFVAPEPLLNLRLFQNRTFATAALVGYVVTLALFGAEFLMPVYLQALRGRTALETGLLLLPLALTSGVVTPIAGRLYDRIGPRPIVVVGFLMLIVNTWQLSRIQADTPIGWIMFLLGLRGFALGCTLQTTLATSLGAVPRQQLPRGSSLINSTRFVVQSLGVAVLSTVLATALSPAVTAQAAQAQQGAAPASGKAAPFGLCETPGVAPADNIPPAAAAQIAALPQATQAAAKAKILEGTRQACGEYLSGFERAYQLTFFIAIVALIVGLFMPGWPLRWAGRGAAAQEGPPAAPAH